jgi:predicted transcriptional regulator
MKVRELMTSPAVTTTRSTSVGQVARQLIDHGVSGIPVTDEHGALVGIVTESDLIVKHANVHGPTYLGILGGVIPFETRRQDEEMRRALGVTAADVMTTKVFSIGPDDDVDDAATIMVDEGASILPVLEGKTVLGTISRTDIVRLLVVEEGEDDARAQV